LSVDAVNRPRRNKDIVRLVVSDVITPKKSGKEVYDEIRKIKPDVKVLLASGYTSEIIHKKGILEEGVHFISKPLTPHDLLCKIRETSDR
jgi:response regulator RpfG family c-di-GMP phosphodiesterase